MSFYGQVEHQLDAKNRIRVPARYRSELGKEYYFMARPQGCIGVLTQEALDRLVAKLDKVTSGDPEMVRAKRVILGSVEKVTEDEQGRVVLSSYFRSHARISKDVITVGNGEILEIWALEAFRKYSGAMSIDDAFQCVDI